MTPAAWAARASERFRSRSTARWAAREPAAARVVPSAVMKMSGWGVEGKAAGQVEGEAEAMGVSFGEEVGLGRVRRA